jgi:hypothetical protein
MQSVAQKDSAKALALRSALHARGLRYRLEWPIEGTRRRIDIEATARRVRRRLFLARVPHPPKLAQREFGMVENQTGSERRTRQNYGRAADLKGLVGTSLLGT